MLDVQKIWNSSQLPTLPTVAIRLLDLTRDPDTEIRDVIEVVRADPAISVKILKAANSSFFGLRSEVKTVDRAIPLLGTTVVTSLALSFSLSDDAMNRGKLVEHYQNFWRQSVVQASAAEVLGGIVNKGLACEYFLAGLLLDLGRLALLKAASKEYLTVLEHAAETDSRLIEAEAELLGVTHVDIGTKLMETWKMPELLVRATQLHHAPLAQLSALKNDADWSMVCGMALCGAVGDYFCSEQKGLALDRIRAISSEFFHFDEERIAQFLQETKSRVDEAAEVFEVNLSMLGTPAELMLQANEQLAQLALREHVASTQAVVRQQAAEKERAELESQNRELQKRALHDPLTKLYNRQFFDDALEREVARCKRAAQPVAVLFVDVDHFKKLNDTYGHQFGDLVLQRIALLFQDCTRSSDVVARYGGEEFVIMAMQPTEKGLEKLAERIRSRIELEEFHCNGTAVHVTVSIGSAMAIPDRRAEDLAVRLVAAADECLYESKRGGRNRVSYRSLLTDQERRLSNLVSQHRFSRWLVAQQLLDIPTVSRALLESSPESGKIGEICCREGFLVPSQVEEVLVQQRLCEERFGERALRLGFLSEAQLVHALSLQQEDPKRLAAILIRGSYAPPVEVATALDRYISTCTPMPNHLEMLTV